MSIVDSTSGRYRDRGVEATIKVRDIRFTHDSVSACFTQGTPLREAAARLVSGEDIIENYPRIAVFFDQMNRCFTINSRRLLIFLRYAEITQQYDLCIDVTILRQKAHWAEKLTTYTAGENIRIRRIDVWGGSLLDRTWERLQIAARNQRRVNAAAAREQQKKRQELETEKARHLERKIFHKNLVRKSF